MIWAFYFALGRLLTPLARLYLDRRRRRGKEHGTRWPERLGHPSLARPPGALVWLHAASVGEAMSVLALIEEIFARHPTWRVLLTTGTVTSAALLADRLGPDSAVTHQFSPIDTPGAVRRFLDHWRPDLALRVESELWPATLLETRRRGIPMALVNARMSPTSYLGWRRARWIVADLLGVFDLVIAQSREDGDRFTRLGAPTVAVLGNLKADNTLLPVDEAALAAARSRLGGRPIWVAASTHDGEEAIVAAVHRRLLARFPGLVTVIVPRHPARGPAIAQALGIPGTRSLGDDLPAGEGLYVADTLGELGLWYRLAPIALIGGTLVPVGGHNPLEATRLGAAVIVGPRHENFQEMIDGLAAAGAIIRLTPRDDDTAALIDAVTETLDRLLSDPSATTALAAAAAAHGAATAGTVARVMAVLEPFFSGDQES